MKTTTTATPNAADLSTLIHRLYRGERIESKGYGVQVTANRAATNVHKMVASVGRLATGEALYHGDVEEAARRFLALTAE